MSVSRPLRLEATVGVHKLHIQSNIKVSGFSDIVLSSVNPFVHKLHIQSNIKVSGYSDIVLLSDNPFHS